MSTPKLFTPLKVGDMNLKHRAVMAPLTRFRATREHVPTPLMAEYYAQRASIPGTLIISEATIIALPAGGYRHNPGIWSDGQVAEWKRVVDAVHAQGSFIFLQLWALGRAAMPDVLEAEGNFSYVSSSNLQLTNRPAAPRPLTIEEVHEYVQLYANAAKNAMRAGFDGVEIHGANGYLIDQFTQDVCNKRTDEYGGSIENRTRFALEVTAAVVAEIGESKTGVRLSPWGAFNDMRMADPKPTFSYFVSEMTKRHPNLAFLHLIEPRTQGDQDREFESWESNDFLREIWSPRPVITAGGYDRDLALEVAEAKGDLIAFGRPFISNPDLPIRLEKNLPIVKGDRASYYTYESPVGYIDYPFVDGTVYPSQFKVDG